LVRIAVLGPQDADLEVGWVGTPEAHFGGL